MWKEFRDFALRGNVLDLAVGIIIGAAFTTVVNSLVNDMIMPPVGMIIGGIDFSDIAITLQEAQGEDPAVTINIGAFINAIINFALVAWAVFWIVRVANRLTEDAQEEEPAEEPAPDAQEKLIETLDRLADVLTQKEE